MNAQIIEDASDIERITQALLAFDGVSAGIAQLRESYEGVVYPVTTTQGMNDAKAARAAIRTPRVRVEKIRKDAKAPLIELGRRIDGDAERITYALRAIEDPIDQQIKAEEARKEAEKQAKVAAEAARVAGHQSRINAMREQLLTASLRRLTSASLHEQINALAIRNVATEGFEEFCDEADLVRCNTMDGLLDLYNARQEEDAEAARRYRALSEHGDRSVPAHGAEVPLHRHSVEGMGHCQPQWPWVLHRTRVCAVVGHRHRHHHDTDRSYQLSSVDIHARFVRR